MRGTLIVQIGLFQLWLVEGAYVITCTNCGFTRRYPGQHLKDAERAYNEAHGGCAIKDTFKPSQHHN